VSYNDSIYELGYLLALHKLCSLNHSGQWSKGYRLMCLAEQRLIKQHGWKSVSDFSTLPKREPGDSPMFVDLLRDAIAFWLKRLKRYRDKL
jgi:hypothetical protein